MAERITVYGADYAEPSTGRRGKRRIPLVEIASDATELDQALKK